MSTRSTTPGRRREATDQRRREILDASLELFLRQGIPGTTMPQICAASGASTGSVYHLFEGKDDIAMTLFLEGMQSYERDMLRSIERKTSLRSVIHALISTHLKIVINAPALSLYLARLGLADVQGDINAKHRELSDNFAQKIALRLRPFAERGELVKLPLELYFSQIIGPAAHLARAWLMGRVSSNLRSAIEPLALAAWKSLRVDAN
ncbi:MULTISPECIES: TetR/AcrR family transcriptional regulator [unclassified Schlesneria]|uniref:TetR/AcrR family transcriptional regulator n=1 Tax=Schlesneria TaxID=656899 RepID=UPI002EE1FB4D